MEIKDKRLLQKPSPIREITSRWDKQCYCEFHEDYGHHTIDCYNLRKQIKELIKEGYLGEFLTNVKEEVKHRKRIRAGEEETRKGKKKGRKENVIHTISGGLTLEGLSNRSRKSYVRKVDE